MLVECSVEIQCMFKKEIRELLAAFIDTGVGWLVGISPDAGITNLIEIIKAYFCSCIESIVQSPDYSQVDISITGKLGKIIFLFIECNIRHIVAGIGRNI